MGAANGPSIIMNELSYYLSHNQYLLTPSWEKYWKLREWLNGC